MIKSRKLRKVGILLFMGAFLIGCEDEFSEIGTDIIGGTEFDTEPYISTQTVSYSKKIEAVQTNALPQYLLGAYDDPIYGLSEVSILTQLSLSVPDPEFGKNAVLDSVVMVLPFYSHATGQTETGTTYALDSIYGSGEFKLSVSESNYFLRSLDPETDFEEPQLYYSNQMAEFEAHLGDFLHEENVRPNSNEEVLFGATDTTRVAPQLRVGLPTDTFQEKVIDQEGSQVLVSSANFQSYFRGLYLKAESVAGKGFIGAFNLSSESAGVYLYYTFIGDDAEEEQGTYKLNFGGNSVNVYNNNFQVDLSSQDTNNGEDKLYLKGGEGSIAVIELFSGPDSDGDGVSDELEELREKNWLINEANLIFSVDENLVPENEKQPQRIFVYNLKDNSVLVDYSFDYSVNENNPLNSRIVHLGSLQTDENGNRYYKIRLTGHISNLLNNDSTNVKLGLSVSSNVNFSSMVKLKDAESQSVSAIPAASVLSPEGTVLYGNAAANEDKKLQLRIYYTKPE